MKEIIKPYVRLSIYELACKISETYPEGFLVKIDNEEDFLMIQYLLRSDILIGDECRDEMDYTYWLYGMNCFWFECCRNTVLNSTNTEQLKSNRISLFTMYYIDNPFTDIPILSAQEAISFLKSLHGVPMSKQQKQRLLDIIKEI